MRLEAIAGTGDAGELEIVGGQWSVVRGQLLIDPDD